MPRKPLPDAHYTRRGRAAFFFAARTPGLSPLRLTAVPGALIRFLTALISIPPTAPRRRGAESRARMLRTWRQVAVAVLIAGAAIAAQLAALAPAQAVVSTITISATSRFTPVTGSVYVVFHGGKYGSARIHGNISGVTAGEVATLYAQRFPYTKAAKPVSSVRLSPPGTTAPYSFSVTPTLATHYWVKLFASGTSTTPLATSRRQNVYVVPSGRAKGGRTCGRPVCHETFRIFSVLPRSALRIEMSKHLYPYFGLRLGATSVPPPPRWLYRNAGHASVARARRISAGEFETTLRFSFRIGNHSYHWNWLSCSKDTVSRDGLGVPGHHGCGARRVLRTVGYLG